MADLGRGQKVKVNPLVAIAGGAGLIALWVLTEHTKVATTTTPTGPPITGSTVEIPQTCTTDENGDTTCDDCDARGDASFASMALC